MATIPMWSNAVLNRLPLPLKLSVIPSNRITSEVLQHLYKFSITMLNEDFIMFKKSIESSHNIHIWTHGETGETVGFQAWRHFGILKHPSHYEAILNPESNSDVVAIVQGGGKLRLHPSIRNFGLHLHGNLLYFNYLKQKYMNQLWTETSLDPPLYRGAITNIYGFVTLASSINNFYIFNCMTETLLSPSIHTSQSSMSLCQKVVNEEIRWKDTQMKPYLATAARFVNKMDNFIPDSITGLVNVHVQIPLHTLNSFSPSYYDQLVAQWYASVNPQWKSTSMNVTFGWQWNDENVRVMQQRCDNKIQKIVNSNTVI